MVKKRKKKDTGESLLSSTSSDCDYEESPALQDADAFAPFRVADYCRRYPEDAEAKYEFIVFVESTNEVPLGNRDMMSLSASFIRSVKGIQYLKKINKYKVGVVFQRANLANAFLDNATFLKEQRLKASIPAGATELAGVISSVPTHLSNHKIYKAISTTKKVISVRRIMRKVRQENNTFTLQPTQSVVITFASATSLPDYVHIKMWRLPVSAYVPPIKQCFKCLRYDHLAKFCKNSARCSICTEGHSFKECKVNIEKAKCINCNGNHIAISGQCPIRQKKIANMIIGASCGRSAAAELCRGAPRAACRRVLVVSGADDRLRLPRACRRRLGVPQEALDAAVSEECARWSLDVAESSPKERSRRKGMRRPLHD
ncbi:hypothetical protein KGM_203558 [Danaus plexippus plexippus]|uniref:Uncharacterized protein n=1 Tax=Danaus plexippus plexippus TaxID=278856 RepID=A0A212ENX5_DANPL|nr:hypothetical protein KGM_203558 [Danaus plexippus plexippus]